jgi:SAM-dependent methyltransferase
MPESGAGMYERILVDLCRSGALHRDQSVLVQFAGEFDREVMTRLGLRNVTFANLAPDSVSSRLPGAVRMDAHRVDLPDLTFDHVVCHAGLHHCSRPHEALHEMYRLARRTVVAVENQDSSLMRLACRLGLAGSYEHAAVADGGGITGGVDGTGVPNHVYRWTRREVCKTVASFDPGQVVPIEFHAQWLIGADRALTPVMRSVMGERGAPRGAALIAALNAGLNGTARRQGNIFAFTIRKDRARPQSWTFAPALSTGAAL